ncbi:HBR511Cp [Eremothecium sinecaudum]|uniref:HBR511Cp n=1 Tax=Eremothecium sinecaudum TaxID=45286 RepID=A0A120K1I7_9SACH|nr:HBR511Cp [Eremothecium sinecaudum]AMD19412.1 HBR511Cp [Eremothecium sinecaudum]
MVRFTYRDVCTIGSALILMSTCFIMGVFFANQTYDYHILFNPKMTQEHYDNALRHYQTLYYTSPKVLYAFAAFATLGMLGSLARVYKPNPELQLFEYGSMGMYFIGICVFLTNIKTGVESAVHGNWGEVTQNQGLAVIASSNIILLLVFSGVIALQAGLWYTEWEYEQRLAEFNSKEAAEAKPAAVEEKKRPAKGSGGKKNAKKE